MGMTADGQPSAEIQNSKLQIPNKFKIPNTKPQPEDRLKSEIQNPTSET